MTWIMIPVLFMNSRDWYAILFKKHYLKSSILSIGAMVVQVNTRTSKILWICATMWMTGFHAIWSFFATSHGKSPCDGLGGKVKRKIVPASLQRPITNQILTFNTVEEFCKENIVWITFFSIYKKDMLQVREVLDARYSLGDTVFGTRSCHHFEPSSTTLIKGKQLSDEHVYTIKNHSSSALPTASEIALALKPNDYATCILWWLLVVGVSWFD